VDLNKRQWTARQFDGVCGELQQIRSPRSMLTRRKWPSCCRAR